MQTTDTFNRKVSQPGSALKPLVYLAALEKGLSLGTEVLDDIDRAMSDSSICGLGQTAASAVRSAIRLGLIGGEHA